jgi:CubicO group peptidase (beta-lactamase class C family)
MVIRMRNLKPLIFAAPAFVISCATTFSVSFAESLVVPRPEQVRSTLQQYVDESKMAPGAVIGVIQSGRREIYSYGDSGRERVTLGQETLFEIGSISKVFTGLLLAEMVLNEELNYSDTVAELAPEGYSFSERVGTITLEQLVTHTSGLPRVAIDPGPIMRGLFTADPYAGSTPDEIFKSVAFLSDDRLSAQGEFAYSNLGYGLLGQLLAEEAGQEIDALLTDRVLLPLGLSEVAFEPGQADPSRLAQGFNQGRAAPHWSFGAYLGAGGLIASVNQLLDFTETSLIASLDFVAEAQRSPGRSSGERARTLGLGYSHREIGGEQWLWHNGGTGGFRSYFGFAPERNFGIVILTNGTGNADRLADVLIRSEASPLAAYERSWFGVVMALMGIIIAPATLLTGLFAKPRPDVAKEEKPRRRQPDRLDLFVLATAAGMLLAVSRLTGDWISIPFSFWWLGLGLSMTAAVALFGARFAEREWRTGGALSLFGRALLSVVYLIVIVAFA